MAPSRKRSIKSAAIPNLAIEQTASALQSLPEREKETLSLREAIAQLQEPIRTALDRGYSYEEVTAMLAEQGINISMFSLKRYLSLTRSRSEDAATNGRGKGKTRRTRTAQASKAAEPSIKAASAEEPASQSAPAPKSKRQSKAATSAKASTNAKSAAKAKPAARTTTRKTTTARGRKKSGT